MILALLNSVVFMTKNAKNVGTLRLIRNEMLQKLDFFEIVIILRGKSKVGIVLAC